jgi:hypothetical protein
MRVTGPNGGVAQKWVRDVIVPNTTTWWEAVSIDAQQMEQMRRTSYIRISPLDTELGSIHTYRPTLTSDGKGSEELQADGHPLREKRQHSFQGC